MQALVLTGAPGAKPRPYLADPEARLDPGYHLEEPTPRLTCVDNLGTTSRSASRALEVFESLPGPRAPRRPSSR